VQHFRLTDSQVQNVEPAKVNRDVALRALWSNSLFSRVVFS
jgi:hypothetical protein